MTVAPQHQTCRRLERWLMAYLDGELDAVHILEVEEHLQHCELCAAQIELDRATRGSLRQVAAMRAPSGLRERVCRAIVAERRAEQDAARERAARGGDAPPRLVQLRFVLPLAAAATLVLVVGALRLRQPEAAPVASAPSAVSTAGSVDRFLDDLVLTHAQPPPPEVTDMDGLNRLDPYVGVRVPHPRLESVGARYTGARIHSRSAMLQYLLRDRHRVTLYVFDPTRMPYRDDRLQRRLIGTDPVYVGHVRGYAVAASERRGVGYALASDLSDDESANLVLLASR